MVLTVLFAVFALIAVISGILVITARHPVKAVLSLIVTFVATSGTWMLLQAEFLSLVLIVVYVGAVMVLFLFVVMMLDVEKTKHNLVVYWPFAGGIAIVLFVLLLNLIGYMPLAQIMPNWDLTKSNILQVGVSLFSTNLYPFEIAAVILLVAMIAAIALTFRGRNPSVKSQRADMQVQVKAAERLKLVDIERPQPVEIKPSADSATGAQDENNQETSK